VRNFSGCRRWSLSTRDTTDIAKAKTSPTSKQSPRLDEAIAPGVYHVAICSAFREPFQNGLGKQQVAILSKFQAQAAWAEPWKSMNGVDPPRGFAFAWFKIGNEEIGVYSVHLKKQSD
jgi:hypothetical protein